MATRAVDRSVWAQLTRACAGLSAFVALARGLPIFDRESLAIGAALAMATVLTLVSQPLARRLGWIGVAGLFVNQGLWMISATVALTSAAPSTIGAAVPAVLSVAAVTGLVGSLIRVRASGAPGARLVGLTAVALAAALTIAVPVAGANAVGVRDGDLRIATRNLTYRPQRLTATAGDVAVVVTNDDLFWHTFTVNKFNANVNVATGGRKRLILQDVAPGRYDFVCAVPGHEGAGMKGVLVVT